MMFGYEEALAELEALHRRVPAPIWVGNLLARRHRIVVDLASQIGNFGQRPNRPWTERRWRSVKLVAAGVWHQLQELHRAAWHVGALSADLLVCGATSN